MDNTTTDRIINLIRIKRKKNREPFSAEKKREKQEEKEKNRTEKKREKQEEKEKNRTEKKREKQEEKEKNRTEKKREKQEEKDKKKTDKKKKRKLVIMDSPQLEPPVERLNERIAAMLSELSLLMLKRGDSIRSRVYKKAEETVLGIIEDIHSIEDVKDKPGIGPTIIDKIKELLETGTLALIEKERNRPENILTDVYGIGPQKAKELVEKNIHTIKQLREQQEQVLNTVQKIGLKYYEDILEKIPRKEIDDYKIIFEKYFQEISDPESYYEIVGSWRRGSQQSGDIDVIITSKNPEVFIQFINKLIENKIIIEVLSRGKSKSLVICKIPSSNKFRRVDFLYTSPEEYPFAVLYFTGSKAFNTVMRGHALKHGYSINEHGMTNIPTKEKVKNVFDNEKSIFDFLGLVYKTPEERIDGRSVNLLPENREPLLEPVLEPIIAPVLEVKEKTPPKKIIPKEKKTRKKNIKIVEDIPTTNNEKMNESHKIVIPNSGEPAVIEEKAPGPPGGIQDKISLFKRQGISVLEQSSEKDIEQMIKTCNDYYYNTKSSLLTDSEYDILKEYAEKKYPKNEIIKQIGEPVKKNKVALPYVMASMDKIKPDTNALSQWKQNYSGPYLLSCKLDGVSGLLTYTNGIPKLYTRGNGTEGQDISHFIKILSLPENTFPKNETIAIRGEFIIPKKIFEQKYKNTFANARNLVSGIINSKTIDSKAKDLHFVSYEIIHPPMKPSEQLSQLKKWNYEVVQHIFTPTITNDSLSSTLLDWRSSYEYEMDGIIVADDHVYPRSTGNPEHAFAFKMVISDQIAEAKVVDVIWTPSKNGYLKPRVRIEPLHLSGVVIEYATGFNAKFIEDNKIGIGAIIQIIRSGDVIPHIRSVTTPAENAKMPDASFHWTDTHVDIVLDNVGEDTTVREKSATQFFVMLKVDGLSIGNVKRLFEAGFDSVAKIIHMTPADFLKVKGFKLQLSDKIYNSLHEKIEKASLLDIMVASNKMGRGLGERKLKPVLEKYPDILTSSESPDEKETKLTGIEGIGKKNAQEFVQHIPDVLAFIRECSLETKLRNIVVVEMNESSSKNESSSASSHPLYKKKIVMTKVRDKIIIDFIEKHGAVLENTMTRDVFILIVKSKEDQSNKTEYAVKNKIPIMTVEEFSATYVK